ncbi:MAG: hypothetical protein H7263_08115 [Candidatus Sericytochromatia bacterium]|nr:hypothetical protein [Candidatus Sericytochromatia bacterium]
MAFNPLSSIVGLTGSKKLGNILLKMNAINQDDLNKALKIKDEEPKKLLGEIIVERNFSTQEQVNEALDQQKKEFRLGQLLVSSGLLKPKNLDEALIIQKETKEKIGVILVRMGFSTEIQISNALKFQNRDNRLGTVLVREGYITETQLEWALSEQEKRGGLLGENLINLKLITSPQLTDALLKQSRV